MTGSAAPFTNSCESFDLEIRPTRLASGAACSTSSGATDSQELLWELPDWRRTQVVVVGRSPISNTTPSPAAAEIGPGRLNLVVIPQSDATTVEFMQMWQTAWEELPPLATAPIHSILLTMQGAQILWRPERVVVVAPVERLTSVCRAIVEATVHETELRSIEVTTDAQWGDVDQHAPLAFEFNSRALDQRPAMAERFRAVQSLRARFARLAPYVLVPHVHPPTLASQIGERLRERMRMPERLELLDHKLDAQERVYEMCSQRVSEFMIARRGHRLEWLIVFLLLIQTMFVLYEFFSASQ